MRRRSFLATAAASVALLGSGGCRLDDPTIRGTPAAAYSPPPPPPYPGAEAVAALESIARTALLAAAGAPGADAASMGKLAAIRTAHLAVLATPEPTWRRPAATPSAAPAPAPAATLDSALAAASTALDNLRVATVARAVADEGLGAALWASLAASAEQSRLWLARPVGSVAPAVPGRVVAVDSDGVAFDLLLERYHETVYGLSSLLGYLPAAHTLRPVLAGLLAAARSRRDALTAYDRAASATPSPGAGAYSVPAAGPDQVPAVAGALLRAVTAAAAVWVASAPPDRRARAVQELIAAASSGLPLGSGVAEWPGWPD